MNTEETRSIVINFYSNDPTDTGYFGTRDTKETRYRSGVAFEAFLSENHFFDVAQTHGGRVLDIGCGTGSETSLLAKTYPSTKFLGIDINDNFIDAARDRYPDIHNLSFQTANWLDLRSYHWFAKYSSAISVQCLSFMEWYHKPLEAVCCQNIQQLAFSTLAWDGPFDSRCEHYIKDENNFSKTAFYNVYSIDNLNTYLESLGYACIDTRPFVIDIDLPKPREPQLQSYTIKLDSGERILISGWQTLPYQFFLYRRAANTRVP